MAVPAPALPVTSSHINTVPVLPHKERRFVNSNVRYLPEREVGAGERKRNVDVPVPEACPPHVKSRWSGGK